MAPHNKNKKLNRWTELRRSELRGDEYFIDYIIYSPENRTGLSIAIVEVEKDDDHYKQVSLLMIDMATGDIKPLTNEENYDMDTELVTYYFLNETEFVLVMFKPNSYSYIQQFHQIYKDILFQWGDDRVTPAHAPSDYSGISGFGLVRMESIQPTIIQGKKFLVLPVSEGLALLPWNPLSSTLSLNQKDDAIYVLYNPPLLNLKEFSIIETNYYPFNSQIFFPVLCQNDSEIPRKVFDRFFVLDLADIDLSQKEIVLKDENENFKLISLQPKTAGRFTGTGNYRVSQRGKYVISTEDREFTDNNHSRPGLRSRIYIIDLENLKTTLVRTRIEKNCNVTLFNSSLLIWKSRFAVEFDEDCEEDEEMMVPRVIHEYRTVPVTGLKTPSLFSLAKNSLMFGRNGVTLPQTYIDRFFKKSE